MDSGKICKSLKSGKICETAKSVKKWKNIETAKKGTLENCVKSWWKVGKSENLVESGKIL